MSAGHTPGLMVTDFEFICLAGQHVAGLIGPDGTSYSEQVANAERIAACWNAFDGVALELIPASFADSQVDANEQITAATEELDRLRAENERLRNALRGVEELANGASDLDGDQAEFGLRHGIADFHWPHAVKRHEAILDFARAALAKGVV